MSETNKLTARDIRILKARAEAKHKKDLPFKKQENAAFLIYLATLVIIALSVRTFIFEPIRVDGVSMVPTLMDREMLFVEKVSFWVSEPKRGEIILVYYPGYTKSCVKRVIGLPGDTVEVSGGLIYVNGAPLDESEYWNDTIYWDSPAVTVPEDHVYVVGDNRNESLDSRHAEVGTIPYNKIAGRAHFVIWPISNWRGI